MANKSSYSTLKSRADFLFLKNSGLRVFPSHWMLVSFSTNDLGQVRCGWTIPTYVGPAVVRNRLKRWGREYFRLNAEEFLGLDLNMVFRRQDKKFYRDLNHEELDQVFEKLKVKIKRPKKMGGSRSSASVHK